MEIHAPHGPPTTWKDTLAQLAIITAGVLIALALEGTVAWIDHRLLVHEAAANLSAELRANKDELDGLFENLDKQRQQLMHADEIAKVMLAHETIEDLEFEVANHSAELKNAAVTTSQVTGALGYMDYGDVSRYASIYDLQSEFMRLQERQGPHFFEVIAFVRHIASGRDDRPTDEDIRHWRSAIDLALADTFEREQIGRQLQKRYTEFLAAK